MVNNKKEGSPAEVIALSNELIYQRYLFNKDRVKKHPRKLSRPEYIALTIIRKAEEKTDNNYGRTYLKEIAEQMQIPVRQISNMVGKLKERGVLLWSHDGDGSEGTYVMLTESGRRILADEEKNLKNYYGKVINKFGKDNLIQMFQLMKQLESIMNAEMEELEDEEVDRQAE